MTPISLTEMGTGTSPGMYIKVPVLFLDVLSTF